MAGTNSLGYDASWPRTAARPKHLMDLPLNFKRFYDNEINLEIGWFWGRLGRDHVMLLVNGDIEIPSDLHGLEYYGYHEKVAEVFDRIQQFFRTHGVL